MAKLCLQNLDDYEEHSQQARYYRGKMSLDKMCSCCENVVTPEEQQEYECPYCGEVAGLIEIE